MPRILMLKHRPTVTKPYSCIPVIGCRSEVRVEKRESDVSGMANKRLIRKPTSA